MELYNVNVFDQDGKCIDSIDVWADSWQEAEQDVAKMYCREGWYCLAS